MRLYALQDAKDRCGVLTTERFCGACVFCVVPRVLFTRNQLVEPLELARGDRNDVRGAAIADSTDEKRNDRALARAYDRGTGRTGTGADLEKRGVPPVETLIHDRSVELLHGHVSAEELLAEAERRRDVAYGLAERRVLCGDGHRGDLTIERYFEHGEVVAAALVAGAEDLRGNELFFSTLVEGDEPVNGRELDMLRFHVVLADAVRGGDESVDEAGVLERGRGAHHHVLAILADASVEQRSGLVELVLQVRGVAGLGRGEAHCLGRSTAADREHRDERKERDLQRANETHDVLLLYQGRSQSKAKEVFRPLRTIAVR